jgi:hypothetical protein
VSKFINNHDAGQYPFLRRVKSLLTVHASMTRPDDSTQSKRDIDLRDRRTGYNGIGYHWLIQRDGTVEKGRDESSASVHDDGISLAKSAVSICLIGGLDARGRAVKQLHRRSGRCVRAAGPRDRNPALAHVDEISDARTDG